MDKSPDAFRTISEVAEWLGLEAHVLRFWESKFSQVKPIKRAGGRRYYRAADMQLLAGIQHLLHTEGLTIKATQQLLRERGTGFIMDSAPEGLRPTEPQIKTPPAPMPAPSPKIPVGPAPTVVERPSDAPLAASRPQSVPPPQQADLFGDPIPASLSVPADPPVSEKIDVGIGMLALVAKLQTVPPEIADDLQQIAKELRDFADPARLG